MHVFFDEQTFLSQAQGGISRYFTELARALGVGGARVLVFGGLTRNLYLPGLAGCPNVQLRFGRRRDQLRINKLLARVCQLWRRRCFGRFQATHGEVIYHATFYDVDPWIAQRSALTCLTVFDLIGELWGEEPRRSRSFELKRRGAGVANVLFCISEQTSRDWQALFPGIHRPIHVTPLASSLPAPTAADLNELGVAGPYLLLIGNRTGYKNGEAGLRAFVQLAGSHPNLRLVCFGGEPLTSHERALLDHAGVGSRVEARRGGDGLLAAFYSRAAALLYPSRYEGFGLPVLEAMQLGCPVVTTPCASLPEVAGDAAIYRDPDDVHGLAQSVDRLLRDSAWREHWRRAGLARAQTYSWPRTAALTQAAYQEHLQARAAQSRASAGPGLQACSGSTDR